MPNLVKASIKFHSNADGKDADTHLSVSVYDLNLNMAANADGTFGAFNAQSDNVIPLNVLTQIGLGDIVLGQLDIKIAPWKRHLEI